MKNKKLRKNPISIPTGFYVISKTNTKYSGLKTAIKKHYYSEKDNVEIFVSREPVSGNYILSIQEFEYPGVSGFVFINKENLEVIYTQIGNLLGKNSGGENLKIIDEWNLPDKF